MILPLIYGAVVGISLGLTGGGGSIFAVPLLMFGMGLPLRDAVTISLLVVGTIAAWGAVLQRSEVVWRAGLILGIGGMLGAPIGARIGIMLPETLVLMLFIALMLFLGWRMWKGRGTNDIPFPSLTCSRGTDGVLHFHLSCALKVVTAGFLTGILSGVLGVGGGFLIVPSLLMVTGMPMRAALATSLVAIAWISAAAFFFNYLQTPDLSLGPGIWFLGGGLLGMVAGNFGKRSMSDQLLAKLFAVAVFAVALWMLVNTVFEI